MLLTLKFKILI